MSLPPTDQDYLNLALLQLHANDLNGAKETLSKGHQRVPGSGKIFWGLGLISALEGDDTQAAEQLERAVDLLPEWPGGYSTLGVFYYQSGQIDKAREVLNRFKNSTAIGTLDIGRIEQALDQSGPDGARAAGNEDHPLPSGLETTARRTASSTPPPAHRRQ